MKHIFVLALVFAAGVASRAVYFSSAPATVDSGTAYTVTADEWSNGGSTEVILYRNGSFVAYASGWAWASASHSTTDYGAQTVTYEAFSYYYEWETGYEGGDYAAHNVSVAVANQAPTIVWVQNPSMVPVGQYYAVQARANDTDGNLWGVLVDRDGSPYAHHGGAYTTELYSSPNVLSSSSTGQTQFTAYALDNNWAASAVIYHTVTFYVPNVAPTITWINHAPATAWINGSFAVQARGQDGNGNLAYVRVWKNDDPFAFNGGGDGWSSYSDNNVAYCTTPGSMTFKALAIDASGADSGFIAETTVVSNRPPTMSPTNISGPTVTWDSQYVHYRMWAGGGDQPGGGQLTMTSVIEDADSNLVNHTLRYRQVSVNPNTWYQIGTDSASGAISTKSYTLTNVETPGEWDFNAWGHDGLASHPGQSKTVWVYGNTNAASFVSQKINNSVLNSAGATIELESGANPLVANTATAEILMKNTGSKPWRNSDDTPHVLAAIGATPLVWGDATRPMPANSNIDPEVFPGSNDTATFAFTFTIPRTPTTTGNSYKFQWKMREQGVAGDGFFESATPVIHITVKDTTPPTAPAFLPANPIGVTTLTLNWSPSVENGLSLTYHVYLVVNSNTLQLLGSTTQTSFEVGNLKSGLSYTFRVVAQDGVNLTAQSTDAAFATVFDPNLDNDGDGVANGIEQMLGLDWNNPNDVRVYNYTYDKANQIKTGPGGQYVKDSEGNIKKVQQ